MRTPRELMRDFVSAGRTFLKAAPSPGGMGIRDSNPILQKMFGLAGSDDGLTSPYSQIPIVYASIRAVEKVFAMTPWKLFKGDREVDERDPVFNLFARPNPAQSADDLRVSMASNLQMKGNAFVVISEERYGGGIPIALYAWPSSYFSPKYNDAGQWVGWTMKRGKAAPQFLPPERVIHVRTYNPADELMGLAPLDVLKQSYGSLWEAVVYNRKFFRNDGTPAIIYKVPKGFANDRDEQKFKAELEARRGAKGAYKSQVLEGEVEVEVVGFNQKDMQFLELVKYFGGDVLMVFGVTKTQVGMYEDVNYATALSQDKVFITSTCLPMMRKVESQFNSSLLAKLGYRIAFDERSNQALTYISSDEADKIASLVGGPVMTANEGRSQIGLPPVPWGDEQPGLAQQFNPIAPQTRGMVSVRPIRQIEAASIPAEFEVKQNAALEEEMNKARRTNTWHGLNARISPQVRKAETDLRAYYHAIEVKARRLVGKDAQGAAVVKDVSESDIDGLFDDAKLQRLIEKHLKASLTIGGATLDVAIDLAAPEVLQYLGSRVQYMIGVNADAKAKLRETIARVLRESQAAQLTEPLRAQAVADALKADFSALKGRARMIARTEVHSSFADGRWKAAEELQPTSVEWISSRDALVRDSHRNLDGKTVPFGKAFTNGCRYPLDPAGGPGEVINCRCNFQLQF